MTVKVNEAGQFVANFPGDDPIYAIFGPECTVAQFGETVIRDKLAHERQRIEPSKEFLDKYESFYEFAGGGVFGLIVCRKGETVYRLSIIVSPANWNMQRGEFDSWEAAWENLKAQIEAKSKGV